MTPRTTTLPLCKHEHRLVAGNLIHMGPHQKCGRCNSLACRRWYRKHKRCLWLIEQEALLRRIQMEHEQ
jgi:hypothetical protein